MGQKLSNPATYGDCWIELDCPDSLGKDVVGTLQVHIAGWGIATPEVFPSSNMRVDLNATIQNRLAMS